MDDPQVHKSWPELASDLRSELVLVFGHQTAIARRLGKARKVETIGKNWKAKDQKTEKV